jgi:hypothetical protein
VVPEHLSVTTGGDQGFLFPWRDSFYRRMVVPTPKISASGVMAMRTLHLTAYGVQYALEIVFPCLKDEEQALLRQLIIKQREVFHSLNEHCADEQEACMRQGARRSWKAVQEAWLPIRVSSDSIGSNIIANRAQCSATHRALSEIVKAPNRQLQRHRGFIGAPQVTEVDATCLQWYAKQPGATLMEKAGANQKILAVLRKENFNTLENRVFKAVCGELLALCEEFLEVNCGRSSSDKYKAVKKFRKKLKTAQATPFLEKVAPQVAICTPNYVLSCHPHYKQIWNLFCSLRRNRRENENIWEWQTALWADSCRQLTAALFTYLCKKHSSLEELAVSMAYIRQEPFCGQWLDAPVMPGPFLYDGAILEIYDWRDGTLDEDIAAVMGPLGCDQLISYSPASSERKMLAVWFHHGILPLETPAYRRLQQSLCSCPGNSIPCESPIAGLVLASSLHCQEVETSVLEGPSPLTVISIPHSFQSEVQIERMATQFAQALTFLTLNPSHG